MKKLLCKLFGHRFLTTFSHSFIYKSYGADTINSTIIYQCERCDLEKTFSTNKKI